MKLSFDEVEHVCSPMLGVGAKLQDIWARALKELLKVAACIVSEAFGHKAASSVANANGAYARLWMLGEGNESASCKVASVVQGKIACCNRFAPMMRESVHEIRILQEREPHFPAVPAPLINCSPRCRPFDLPGQPVPCDEIKGCRAEGSPGGLVLKEVAVFLVRVQGLELSKNGCCIACGCPG